MSKSNEDDAQHADAIPSKRSRVDELFDDSAIPNREEPAGHEIRAVGGPQLPIPASMSSLLNDPHPPVAAAIAGGSLTSGPIPGGV